MNNILKHVLSWLLRRLRPRSLQEAQDRPQPDQLDQQPEAFPPQPDFQPQPLTQPKEEVPIPPKRLITYEEVVRKYPEEDITPLMRTNLSKLLDALNKFRAAYGKPMIVTSGLRTQQQNDQLSNAGKKSAHLTGEACDFADVDRSITNFVLANPSILVDCDLYMEEPSATPTWCHLSCRRPYSGRRIFQP